MLQEGAEQRLAPLEGPAMTPSRLCQVLEFIESLIGQGVGLQVTPDVLCGIQFRRIGGQEHRVPASFMGDRVFDKTRSMGHEPVPE